jgi:5-methyltetrahydropteroyltriglutamate--homocysteine methyltransferase
MQRSETRVLVSHAGVLPRPEHLLGLMRDDSTPKQDIEAALPMAVAEVVRHQVEAGIDVINDGELSKAAGFSSYMRERMTGIEQYELQPGESARTPNKRDQRDFPGFYAAGLGQPRNTPSRLRSPAGSSSPQACVGPLSYVGQEALQRDIKNLLAALPDPEVEAFLPAVAPGTIEHWLWNRYYPDDESFLYAIADALHEEYRAITDAGLVVQIDDPDLPDGWQTHPEMDVPTYRKYAKVRVDALNHALRDIPQDLVRFHICWGSQHGPHKDDIPLRDIIDLVLEVHAQCYSIEAANPTHEHEWRIWEEVSLPEGKSLMPGVVGHASDLIEHPELVAQRLERVARLVGRENVIAGTDCGLASRVAHPEICWAKLGSLVEGARLASLALW